MITDPLTPEQLSEMTGISLDRLKNLRYERKLFPFYKVPDSRAVVYDRLEVLRVLQQGKVEVQR